MITATLLNARTLLELGAAVSRERELVLQDENPADAAAAVHKLTRYSSVSMALAADMPPLSSKLRMAVLELHAAEEALWRDQPALATRALGDALAWIDAARAEAGDPDETDMIADRH